MVAALFFAHNILVFLFSRTYTLLSASVYIRCMWSLPFRFENSISQHLSSDKNHQDTDERTLQWKSWSWLTSQVKVLGVKLWELSCWEVQSLLRQKHSGSVTDWTSLPAWYHLQGIRFVDLPFTLAWFWEWHRWSCRCCWPRKTNLLFGRAGSWKHRLFWLRTRTSVIRVVSCVACSYHVTIMWCDVVPENVSEPKSVAHPFMICKHARPRGEKAQRHKVCNSVKIWSCPPAAFVSETGSRNNFPTQGQLSKPQNTVQSRPQGNQRIRAAAALQKGLKP